jgi:hypothetical protein
MIKFLTTQGINYHLEELLKNSQKEIILISPYFQLQKRIKEILSQKKDNGLDISFVCRANDLKEDLSMVSTKIFDCPTLHAKCYMNENEAIVTSLNLYEFSQQNNEEMGFYIKNSDASEQIFREITTEAKRLCRNQINPPPPPSSQDILVVGKNYSLPQLDSIFNFVGYSGSQGIKVSASGDIVLFSNSSSPYGKPVEKDGIIYYQGQKGGLTGNNKVLYDSYEKESVTIYFFKDYVYVGKFYIKMIPYQDKGRWFFPLAKK